MSPSSTRSRRRPPVSPYHLTPSSRALLALRAAQIRRRLAERKALREQLGRHGETT